MQSIKVKVLTFFMSLVMAVSCLPAFASNAATTDSAAAAAAVSYSLDSNGVLRFSGNGAIPDYNMNQSNQTDAPWFSKRSQIKKVVIGDGITRIGNNAFENCYNITEIQFSSARNLTAIGTQAFMNCSGLTSVILPEGLTGLGWNAFAYDYNLVTVKLPSTLKSIGRQAFVRCRSLRSIYIPSSVNTIGTLAFGSNYNLVKVTGGAGLVSIGAQAFQHCYALKSFSIVSKKLKKIGKGCFICCSKLKTINIKKTTKLTKKGVKASLYLSSVKKVKVKKSKVKKYKKYFTYRNCYKRGVKVKK